MNTEVIRNAYTAGERTAKGYKVGDVFLGAIPEAEKQGFDKDPVARSVFIHAYIANLAKPIICGRDDNKLIQYGAAA